MTLAALFAGVFIGVGLGIVFRFGGTTGGVDIIAKLGFKYLGWSMGKTMFAFDASHISHVEGHNVRVKYPAFLF